MSGRGVAISAGLLVVAIGIPLSPMIKQGLAEERPLAAPVTREFAAAGRTRAVFLYEEDVPTHRMNLRIRIERHGKLSYRNASRPFGMRTARTRQPRAAASIRRCSPAI